MLRLLGELILKASQEKVQVLYIQITSNSKLDHNTYISGQVTLDATEDIELNQMNAGSRCIQPIQLVVWN